MRCQIWTTCSSRLGCSILARNHNQQHFQVTYPRLRTAPNLLIHMEVQGLVIGMEGFTPVTQLRTCIQVMWPEIQDGVRWAGKCQGQREDLPSRSTWREMVHINLPSTSSPVSRQETRATGENWYNRSLDVAISSSYLISQCSACKYNNCDNIFTFILKNLYEYRGLPRVTHLTPSYVTNVSAEYTLLIYYSTAITTLLHYHNITSLRYYTTTIWHNYTITLLQYDIVILSISITSPGKLCGKYIIGKAGSQCNVKVRKCSAVTVAGGVHICVSSRRCTYMCK